MDIYIFILIETVGILMLIYFIVQCSIRQDDPVYSCAIYEKFGCSHVDGMLCDMKTCSTLEQYKAREIYCPVCGYYCLGKGGMGCIDKPKLTGFDLGPI